MTNVANIDLRLLRVFTTIVECGGFSAAQTELNISQSTISNHMIALEERLRSKLCQRGRSGFQLTDQGKIVYDAAVRLFASIDEFHSETESLHGTLTGELRIGVVDNTVTDPRAPTTEAIRRFSARSNSVHIKLIVDSPPALQRKLIDRHIDVAMMGFVPRLTNLRYQSLYIESSALYCSESHPLFVVGDDQLSLDKIRRFPFASRSYWCNQDLDRVGVRKAAATVEQMEAQLTLALSGAYLAFLPMHYAKRWVDEGRLRPLLVDDLSYAVRFQLVSRKGIRTTPLVKAFVQDIYGAIGKSRRLEGDVVTSELCSWRPRRTKPESVVDIRVDLRDAAQPR